MFNSFLPPPEAGSIAVGLSGGVDSSVCAYLLKQAGYDIFAIFMKNWDDSYSPGYCSAEEDVYDAQDVCESLDIPLYAVNFSQAYRERVFQHFLDEYAAGRTPNPDVLCNREIKFAEMAETARQHGARFLATGHYAQRRNAADGEAQLWVAADQGKDQSYFLHAITQAQIKQALFPLGALQKSEVRHIAEQAGLITFDKKDSTGICFIGERRFTEFLQQFIPAQPGIIRSVDGEIMGEHQGLMFYTLGQRQGLGIGGRSDRAHEPWYVVDKDLSNKELIVAQGEHPRLYHRRLRAEQLSWIGQAPPPGAYFAKIRYRQKSQACVLHYEDNDALWLDFVQAQRAVTPGQYAVIYDAAGRCYGGGVICQRET